MPNARVHSPLLVGLLVLAITGCSSGSNAPEPPPTPAPLTWTPDPRNPVIESGWSAFGDLLTNDPCVIFTDGTYRMWYSKGTGLGVNHVKLYEATSPDGLTWAHDPTVLLDSDSRVVLTGATVPVTAGVYELLGENTSEFTNGQPAYKRQGADWFLWYDTVNSSYRLSDVLAGDGTASWLGAAAAIVDGAFVPHTGTAAGNVSASSAWDSARVETPMVVRVGGSWHLYYTGAKVGDLPGRYMLGHATSIDGQNWTKDPSNPVVTAGTDPEAWGYYQAAEPGVVFNPNDSTFYLYYTTARWRGAGYSGDLSLMQGIAVATSTDGSSFTFQQMALTQSADYPVTQNFVGYSTPFALIDTTGEFQLFYDVANVPQPGDWRQVALARATSTDGLTFTETQTDIFVFEDVAWRFHEVRAPCVLEENGVFRMWFAGNSAGFLGPSFQMGIGYAQSSAIR